MVLSVKSKESHNVLDILYAETCWGPRYPEDPARLRLAELA
jgi:hypothetical protein